MGCRLLRTASRVLCLTDVTGGHVALLPMCLGQPPLPIARDVLKLQDPEPLVSRHAQLIAVSAFEGVESIIDLPNRGRASAGWLCHTALLSHCIGCVGFCSSPQSDSPSLILASARTTPTCPLPLAAKLSTSAPLPLKGKTSFSTSALWDKAASSSPWSIPGRRMIHPSASPAPSVWLRTHLVAL